MAIIMNNGIAEGIDMLNEAFPGRPVVDSFQYEDIDIEITAGASKYGYNVYPPNAQSSPLNAAPVFSTVEGAKEAAKEEVDNNLHRWL